MTIEEIIETMGGTPLLPIIKAGSLETCSALIDGLVEAGVVAVEIVLRTPTALAAISSARQRHKRLHVAAGTILLPAQLDEAMAAGASFGISPGLTDELAQAIKARNFAFVPGAQTASEVMAARRYGFGVLKYYPAVPSNGDRVLGDYESVFAGTRFVPTGRIDMTTLPDYARLPNVTAVGGSFLHNDPDPAAIATKVAEARAIFSRSRPATTRSPA